MSDYRAHATRLVREYRLKRANAVTKRRRLQRETPEDKVNKENAYQAGLEQLSRSTLVALEDYKDVFSEALPEAKCYIQVRNTFPADLDVTFHINWYSLRLVTRIARPSEEFLNMLVDGMLYCESMYKGGDRRLESQIGLWSDIGPDSWGKKNEEEEFVPFLSDILPSLIELLWNRATLPLIHVSEVRIG